MGESLFLNRQIRNFASSHPQHQGWKIYEIPANRARKGYLHLLLDFLRDFHPGSIRHRATIKELAEEELSGGSPVNPSAKERGQSQELDSTDWYGRVHIKWGSQPIHFMSLLLKNGGGYVNVYHVATKSNVALRQVLAKVDEYGKARRKDEARSVFVVNGEDIPLTQVSWEDIFLPPRFAESIRNNVTAFFQSSQHYRSLGIPHRRGLLFAGPPGCGKTLTLKVLMYETAVKAITVLGKADVEDQHIETAFSLAERHAPAMVVFEDLDKLVQSKNISLAHFLNVLDGFRPLNGVMVIASSNDPQLLDRALIHRPSRFDRVWMFSLPGMGERLALLRNRGQAYFSESALRTAAEKSQGFSMAYVQEIVVNALLESAHNGTIPADEDLLHSLAALHSQRRDSSRAVEHLVEEETVGFALSNQAHRTQT